MSVLQLVENDHTSEFYPTPQNIVEKMFDGIDFDYINTVLEPSAGKGDILRVLASKEHSYKCFDVDCIEIDPNLRQILKYNFSDERRDELERKAEEFEQFRKYNYEIHKYEYEYQTTEQKNTHQQLGTEMQTFFEKGIHIVHDDFLTYSPYKQYDLIIMNPPFSNGDKHLLKALKMQEKGGSIVCLLNAETIKNPHTKTRKELAKKLTEHHAIVEYIKDAFVSAERKTGVEVALIKVFIERVQEESEIYNRMKQAEMVDDFNPDVTDLEVTDYIKAAVNRFNVEVRSGMELIRQYKNMVPYMENSFGGDGVYGKSPILELSVNGSRDALSVNGYLRSVRMKYWKALMNNSKFVGKLTSKLQQDYRTKVASLADYDFTEFNINTLATEMNAQIKRGVEDEIIAMFDRLTAEHTWFPETQKNRHYFDGWATNKAHKIGKKVIIPCYGVFDSWDGLPRTYKANEVLEDIERVLNFLDGGMTRDVSLSSILDAWFKAGATKKIPLKYFNATFYKKGTVHLEFICPDLIERFNIYAARYKAWLPPCYGKKTYEAMTNKEKTVIDGFQGEKAYTEIMERSHYYLAPVSGSEMLRLTE